MNSHDPTRDSEGPPGAGRNSPAMGAEGEVVPERFSRIVGAIPPDELKQISVDVAEAFGVVDLEAWNLA